jgi:hypothetical protein
VLGVCLAGDVRFVEERPVLRTGAPYRYSSINQTGISRTTLAVLPRCREIEAVLPSLEGAA